MKKFFLFLFLALLPLTLARAAEVTDLRWTARTDAAVPFVRLVMDLSEKGSAVAALDESGTNLEITVKHASKGAKVAHDYSIGKQNVKFATVENDGENCRLDVALTKAMTMSDIKIFALKPDAAAGRPHRLVIDISSSATGTAAQKKAESSSVSSKAKKALKGKTICLDPGHGGADVGAIGKLGKKSVYEKDITLSIALPLRDMLKAAGAKVVMTRETDKDVAGAYAEDKKELQARCDIANKAKADAFISIHIDSYSNASIDGTAAHYTAKTPKDLLLAKTLHQATQDLLAIPDRGLRENDLYVTEHTKMPAVLMELGFISNTHRLKMLTSSWGPKRIAESLYNGLVEYFTEVGD